MDISDPHLLICVFACTVNTSLLCINSTQRQQRVSTESLGLSERAEKGAAAERGLLQGSLALAGCAGLLLLARSIALLCLVLPCTGPYLLCSLRSYSASLLPFSALALLLHVQLVTLLSLPPTRTLFLFPSLPPLSNFQYIPNCSSSFFLQTIFLIIFTRYFV